MTVSPLLRRLAPAALVAVGALVPAALLTGCDTGTDRGASIFQPDVTAAQRRPDPTLTSVSSELGQTLIEGVAVSGVTRLVLTGTNFVRDSTYVYVNGKRAPIAEHVSDTRIVIRAPNAVATGEGTLDIKVMRLRAVNFSATQTIRVVAAVKRFGGIGQTDAALGVAPIDTSQANVSMTSSSVSVGIPRVTSKGLGPGPQSTFTWPELAHYNGYVYGVRGVRALFRFALPTGAQETFTTVSPDGNVQVRALDLDADGTIWSGGSVIGSSALALYRTTQARVTTAFPFPQTVTALDATPAALFVGTVQGTTASVWRIPRTADGLGTPAKLADVPDATEVTALAATADGGVIAGVTQATATATAPLRRISATGQVSPHLEGLLNGSVVHMRWADGRRLLVSGTRIVGLETSQKVTGGDLVLVDALVDALR